MTYKLSLLSIDTLLLPMREARDSICLRLYYWTPTMVHHGSVT